jgi:hypothetical protein
MWEFHTTYFKETKNEMSIFPLKNKVKTDEKRNYTIVNKDF